MFNCLKSSEKSATLLVAISDVDLQEHCSVSSGVRSELRAIRWTETQLWVLALMVNQGCR